MGVGSSCLCKDSIPEDAANEFYNTFIQKYQRICSESGSEFSDAVRVSVFKELQAKSKRAGRGGSGGYVLDLKSKMLGDPATMALGKALSSTKKLRVGLNLRSNSITDVGLISLTKSISRAQHMFYLDIASNSVGNSGVVALAQVLESNDSLRVLVVSYNDQIGEEGLSALFSSLQKNLTLRKLDVGGIALGDAAVEALCNLLLTNVTIRELDISHNTLPEGQITKLVASIRKNNHLTCLRIDRSCLTADSSVELQHVIERNLAVNEVVEGIVEKAFVRVSGKAGQKKRQSGKKPNKVSAMEFLDQAILRMCMFPEEFQNKRFHAGHAEMIGRRPTMEDFAVVKLGFRGREEEGYFALFDGHGGKHASEFAGTYLHDLLAQGLDSGEYEGELERLLVDCFLEVNDLMSYHNIPDGTTALVSFFQGNTWFVANAGDTRAVLCRGGKAERLSIDHTPMVAEEEKRVEELGGFVSDDGRVNGILSVSRALGDLFLQPLISPEPYVRKVELLPEDEFLIMACDGLWDVLTDEQAVALVRDEGENMDPKTASAKLRDMAYMQGSMDNISVIVVKFLDNR